MAGLGAALGEQGLGERAQPGGGDEVLGEPGAEKVGKGDEWDLDFFGSQRHAQEQERAPVAQPMLWGWVDCMTLTDRATRLRVVLPLKNKRHVTVKAQLGRLLAAQGIPIKRILCDQ